MKKKRKNWSKGKNFIALQKAITYYRLKEDDIGDNLRKTDLFIMRGKLALPHKFESSWSRRISWQGKTKKQLQKPTSLKNGQNSTEMLWAEIFTLEFCTNKLAEFIFFSIQKK